ncbi:hypothetical protein GCM10023093_11420 [Nemorincola caseinilytica]|uniref:Uncharacterized protein n=2 Tax=Nemorincola caseinilytica TaxID=2054315 RepID=A0ABP8NBX6_9BACT
MLFTSCKRKEYTCWCRISQPSGAVIEENSLGLLGINKAEKKCMEYQDNKTEEFVGYPKQIRCQVITDL